MHYRRQQNRNDLSHLIGQSCVVRSGPHKGQDGRIIKANKNQITVELECMSRKIYLTRDKIVTEEEEK